MSVTSDIKGFACLAVFAWVAAVLVVGCSIPAQQRQVQAEPKSEQAEAISTTEPTVTTQTKLSMEYAVLDERPGRLIVELPNRMVVVAQELPTAPVVTAQAWIKTGSILEQEHIGAGLSHFLEHLLAGGTTSTRNEQASNALLGRIGAQTNAATGHDNVRYYINTASEHTDQAIELVSDWMQNALITETEYARERTVIQREMEMRNSRPSIILWKLTQQARYRAHPARDPIIGYLDDFLSISRDEIHDFYRRMYVPNNTVFLVVGDIDKQAAVDKVASLWADVPAGELPQVSLPVEPEIDGPRQVVGYADIKVPKVRLVWPGTRLGAQGDYELDVLAIVLGQGESSRLKRQVRDSQRLASTVSAHNSSSVWTDGYFAVTAEPTNAETSLNELKAAVLTEIARLSDEPVTQAELDRAKRKVLSGIVQSNQTAQEVASTLAWEIISLGEPGYTERYAQAVQSLTAKQLQAAAKRFLSVDRLITVELLPQLQGQEDDGALTRRQPPPIDPATLEQEPVELDNDALIRKLNENLADADDDAGQIEVDPPVRFTLDNGLRLIVQRSTVVPAVSMQLFWPGGLLSEEPGREGTANAVASMLTRGTTTRSADQISTAVEGRGATLHVTGGNNTAFAQATSLQGDWPAVMKLLADVTVNPSFDPEEWDKLRPRLLAAIDREGETWIGELRQAFRSEYFGSHPWSQVPVGRRDVVESLTVDDLRAFHAAHLGASDAVLSVVGDVDPREVQDIANRLFTGLQTSPGEPFDPPVPEAASARVVQVVTSKPATAFYIGLGPGVRRSDPDYVALEVLTTVMSDFPAGWLEQELRGRGPGLVYSASASAVSGIVPGYTAIVFNTSSPQAVEALTRTMSVVRRAKAGDFNTEDLERAKAKVVTREFFRRQSITDRAMHNALDEVYGLGGPDPDKFLHQVQAVDAEALKRAAEKYLNRPVVVILTNHTLDEGALEAAVRGEPFTQTQRDPVEAPGTGP